MNTANRSRREVLLAGATGMAAVLTNAQRTAAANAPAATEKQTESTCTETPPIHFKISVAGYSFRNSLDKPNKPGKMSLTDLVDLAVKIGLDAIEPTSYYFLRDDDAFVLALKRKAFLAGIEISGTPVGNNFCLPPGPKLDQQIDHVRKWVDICVKLGSPAIRIFGGNKHKELSREEAFANVVSAMKQASEYAASKGIFLAIENHGYLTETADDLLRLIDAVGNDWLGINLDTGNFHGDPYANIVKAAPHAITCQIKTLVRKTGSDKREPADFARIVQILRNAKYRGYLTLEYEGGDPHNQVPIYISKLQALAKP